jgi:hypothetical protein
MKKKTWVLLSLASVLLIFCAVRAVRSPAVSAGAQSTAVCEGRAQSGENETIARFQKARESMDAHGVNAANELQLRQLETARKAQGMKQQEAANELQRRQQEATRPLS